MLANQDRKLTRSIHRYQRNQSVPGLVAKLRCALGKMGHAFWTVLSGSDIHRDAEIDATVRFPHLNGVVIHKDVTVNEGSLIMQQVTLGQKNAGSGVPRVGKQVYIGAGAKVLGDVVIGDNARIGANAVVLTNVPENATAIGNPAKLR